MEQQIQLMRLPAVKATVGLSTSTIYDLIRAGKFPRQVKISLNAVGWRRDEVQAWLAQRVAESSADPAPAPRHGQHSQPTLASSPSVAG